MSTSYFPPPNVPSAASVQGGIRGGAVIGVSVGASRPTRVISAVGGKFRVAGVPLGQEQIQSIAIGNGYESVGAGGNDDPETTWNPTTNEYAPVLEDLFASNQQLNTIEVNINGEVYNNTVLTGGAAQTIDVGNGRKALVVSRIFTVFGNPT